jgi:NADH-quinone oxidoreductase subunit M
MGFFTSHWVLTFLIFAPLVAAAIALLVPNATAKWVALVAGIVEVVAAAPLFWTYEPNGPAMQNQVAAAWIPDWGIFYRLGLDGISLFMVLLTASRSRIPAMAMAEPAVSVAFER